MSVIIKCPGCGQRNGLKPVAGPQRCGKCKREFTTSEKLSASLGTPVATKPDDPLGAAIDKARKAMGDTSNHPLEDLRNTMATAVKTPGLPPKFAKKLEAFVEMVDELLDKLDEEEEDEDDDDDEDE